MEVRLIYTLLAAGIINTSGIGQPDWINLPSFYEHYPSVPSADTWSSDYVFYSNGKLSYRIDQEGNRIPDFSYSGYHYGLRSMPSVGVVMTLWPDKGDQTSRIQSALDAIGRMQPDPNGHKGALLLMPGVYEVWGTIYIRHDGVILRGSGNGTDPAHDTIIYARGDSPHQRTVMVLGTGNDSPWTWKERIQVTEDFVPVGSMAMEVADTASLRIGQEIAIIHPSTQAWIDAIGGGGMVAAEPWQPGTVDLVWIRRITGIEGQRLYIDAPIYNHLDRRLAQSVVAAIDSTDVVTECGIEDLRIEIETTGGQDEDHAWNAVGVIGAQDCWVRKVSARSFGYAGIRVSGAIRITVQDCDATDPVAIRTGGRMYNFAADQFAQLVLFSNCHAAGARHSFISNGKSTASGIVWRCCTMVGGDFEGHRRWSQALLLDNCQELGGSGQAKLMNRGDMGTSHGWGAVHSVIWVFNREIVCQKPPTAQNYAISNAGWLRASPYYPGPWGGVEIRSGQLVPQSLYEAQVCQRISSTPILIIARSNAKAVVPSKGTLIQMPVDQLGQTGRWYIIPVGNGKVMISAATGDGCMQVAASSLSDGAGIIIGQYSQTRPDNDQWQFEPIDRTWYVIRNCHSSKVLTILEDQDPAQIVQMDYAGKTCQQFGLVSIPGTGH